MRFLAGQTKILNPSLLYFVDDDTEGSQLMVTVASEPSHGDLWSDPLSRPLKIGNSFFQQKINNGAVRYYLIFWPLCKVVVQ